MVIITNGRELVNKDAIRRLNQLSWDKKLYANFHFADGVWGLEVNYYFGEDEYCYKVECDGEQDMQRLRAELDENSKLIILHDGRVATVGKR